MLLFLLLFVLHTLPLIPNDKLTPGEVAETNAAKVCVSGYSATVRHTSAALKKKVYAEYGLTAEQCGHCEIDHRVPLLLGGADTLQDLWPESYDTTPGAHQKDALEVRLHVMVCHEHTMTLNKAQHIFLGNWIAAYKQYVK